MSQELNYVMHELHDLLLLHHALEIGKKKKKHEIHDKFLRILASEVNEHGNFEKKYERIIAMLEKPILHLHKDHPDKFNHIMKKLKVLEPLRIAPLFHLVHKGQIKRIPKLYILTREIDSVLTLMQAMSAEVKQLRGLVLEHVLASAD